MTIHTGRLRAERFGGSFTFVFRGQVRRCHLDPATGTVEIGTGREPQTLELALARHRLGSHLCHREQPLSPSGEQHLTLAAHAPASPDDSAACNTLPIYR